jgi:hypothetical protein
MGNFLSCHFGLGAIVIRLARALHGVFAYVLPYGMDQDAFFFRFLQTYQ